MHFQNLSWVCLPNLCYSFSFLLNPARAVLSWIFPPRQITEICWLIAPLLCNLSLSLEFPLEKLSQECKHKSQLPLSQHPAPNSSTNGGKKAFACLMRRHTDCRVWYLSILLCTKLNETSSAIRSMMLLQHLQPSAMRENLPTNRHSE